jgi:HEAT repeat protein
MGNVFGPEAVESLIHGLGSAGWETRASCAWELGLHDGDEVVAALAARLADRDENTAVLMEVIASLDRIRSPESRDALLRFGSRTTPATYQEERCRVHALRAVERLPS